MGREEELRAVSEGYGAEVKIKQARVGMVVNIYIHHPNTPRPEELKFQDNLGYREKNYSKYARMHPCTHSPTHARTQACRHTRNAIRNDADGWPGLIQEGENEG